MTATLLESDNLVLLYMAERGGLPGLWYVYDTETSCHFVIEKEARTFYRGLIVGKFLSLFDDPEYDRKCLDQCPDNS